MRRREFLKLAAAGAVALAIPPQVVDALGSGTITTDGWSASALPQMFQCGDIITIAGRYARNPITGSLTEHLQRFIVTAVSDDTIDIHPSVETRTVRKAQARGAWYPGIERDERRRGLSR